MIPIAAMDNDKEIYFDACDQELLSSTPLVSVHMLVYHHGHFLSQAIDGVLQQICNFNFEIIISDDYSPDETLSIALSYQRRFPGKIRVIHGKSNVGMHRNMARGIQFCRGSYIAFCEGDDFWHHPQKLQMQVDLMESSPEMTFCHTDFNRLTKLNNKKNVHLSKSAQYSPAKDNAYHSILENWALVTATAMYRTDIVKEFIASDLYRTEWPFGDFNLALFSSLKGTLGYISESTATWRKRKGSATNDGYDKLVTMEKSVIECMQAFMNISPVDPDFGRRCIAKRKMVLSHLAYLTGNIELLSDCQKWLEDNGFRSRAAYLARILAMKLFIPRQMHLKMKRFINNQLSAI